MEVDVEVVAGVVDGVKAVNKTDLVVELNDWFLLARFCKTDGMVVFLDSVGVAVVVVINPWLKSC